MAVKVSGKVFGLLLVLICSLLVSRAGEVNKQQVNEDDFDEFEFDFDDEDETDEEDATVTDADDDDDDDDGDGDGDEFDNGEDDSEFDSEEFEDESNGDIKSDSSAKKLEIVESTVEIKPFWEAYFVEICIVLMAVLYLTNYLLGRSKNTQIAETWVKFNADILKNNFEIVGDDGEGDEPSETHIIRRSDNSFVLWASGRINCDGLLVHLELSKRHDLISVVQGIFKPSPDTISFIYQLADGDMDSIVCAVAPRKSIGKVQKEYEDLSNFCSSARSADKHGLQNSFCVLSETFDTASSVLSGYTTGFLSKHMDIFMSMHVSDQYTGIRDPDAEESDKIVVKKPEKRVHLTFKLPTDPAISVDLTTFALRFLDHIKGIKLSREAKEKTTKNRQKVIQNLEKQQHQARQEAAQQRKEEKRKADKDKLLHETDPEKARKMEEKEHKKQLKKSSGVKMKQMKVRMG